MQVTLQAVSRLALSNSLHPTYTPTPPFPMRTLPTETWQSGRPGHGGLAWLLVYLSGEAGNRHPMRTQALVLVLIVTAASEPARIFKTIVNGVVALLQCFKLL